MVWVYACIHILKKPFMQVILSVLSCLCISYALVVWVTVSRTCMKAILGTKLPVHYKPTRVLDTSEFNGYVTSCWNIYKSQTSLYPKYSIVMHTTMAYLESLLVSWAFFAKATNNDLYCSSTSPEWSVISLLS